MWHIQIIETEMKNMIMNLNANELVGRQVSIKGDGDNVRYNVRKFYEESETIIVECHNGFKSEKNVSEISGLFAKSAFI